MQPMTFYPKRASSILVGDKFAAVLRGAIVVYTVETIELAYKEKTGRTRFRLGFVGGKYRYADMDDRLMVFSELFDGVR